MSRAGVADYETAVKRLIWFSETAHFVKRLPSGVEQWRARGKHRYRFRVAPGLNGALPALVTVLTEHDRAR